MKLLWAALSAAILSCITPAVHSRSLDEIRKQGKIVIATEGQYYPFNFFQGPTLTGFEVELANSLAKRMGLSVEWKALGFDALLVGLRQDRWDLVIASHGITEDRAKVVTFANPHYCSGGVIVSKDPTIRRTQDLAGHTVAVQVGTTYSDKVRQMVLGLRQVKTFPQDTEARSAVLAGRADAWVTDQFVAMQSVAAYRGSGLRLGGYLFIEQIAAAASKGNRPLIDAWNKALGDSMADGSYTAISQKYFETDIRCP